MDLLLSTLLVFLSFHGTKSTFFPSGSVSIDCGGQRTFNCTVTANGPARWIITGLQDIVAAGTSGPLAANNARITSAETIPDLTSTITITGFRMADNGGTVQCTDQLGAVEGSATTVVGPTQCDSASVGKDINGNDSCPAYTFTPPQGSPLPSTVMVSYQLVGDPSSAGSLNCDYPVEPQMCRLAVSEGLYNVSFTPQNSCGSSPSACPSFFEQIIADCNITVRTPQSPEDQSGLYSLLVLPLLLLIIITYSISVAVVWHLCYKDYNYCQVYWCCCFCKPREGDGKKRTSSTEPMKASPPPPPAPVAAAAPLGEYADPKDVRKRKEENKIQYADLEFTKQSGGGQGTIHQKEEPVTYTAIQHA